MLGSNWERFGYDTQLTVDSLMATMRTSPQYSSGQTEFKSVPTSKTFNFGLGDRDMQSTSEQLDRTANRKTAGYWISLSTTKRFSSADTDYGVAELII